jgi:hypothetical protein
LLTGLLAAYVLFLAGIAVLVIRGGQVWDDARMILLVIVLLFFMLSASLDVLLVEDAFMGTLLVAMALLFTLSVSEALLHLLRIHLAARYRWPFYLILSLLFLYPAVPAWLPQLGLNELRLWTMVAFPALMGLALLTLLPAARTHRRREPASGTPWIWPYYPWSLFVFLSIGAGLRAWWLTISFEPTTGPHVRFQPYFLLPMCLAWSALLIEIGKTRHSVGAVTSGMLLPLAGLAGVFMGSDDLLTRSMASPPQLAIGGLLLFYLWAWQRNVRVAEGFLVALGLLAAVVGPDTFDVYSLSPPQPWPLACVSAALLLRAVERRSTWRAIAGGGMAILGARYLGMGVLDENALRFWQWHAPLLALMTLSTLFTDGLARWLRELSWRISPLLAFVAATIYPWAMPMASPPVLAGYLALLLLVSISLWQRQKEVGPLIATLWTAVANLLIYFGLVYGLLQHSMLARGLPYLAGGLAVVAAALGISLLKMGMWRGLRTWLQRLNLALGGSAAASA